MVDFRTLIKSTINGSIGLLGLRLERTSRHDWGDTANFIPLASTLEAAKAASMSLADYVDTVMNGVPDGSRDAVRKMQEWGALSEATRSILEIGPGTGRYLEKVIGIASASTYEIYETARPWADYLTEKYHVTLRDTDGYSLASTEDGSIDLAQAHKVFNSIPLMATLCYWSESVRVLRPGGFIVFDIITEDCLSPAIIDRWVRSGIRNSAYPSAIPLHCANDYFAAHGFDPVGSSVFDMPPGKSQLLAFRKRA